MLISRDRVRAASTFALCMRQIKIGLMLRLFTEKYEGTFVTRTSLFLCVVRTVIFQLQFDSDVAIDITHAILTSRFPLLFKRPIPGLDFRFLN